MRELFATTNYAEAIALVERLQEEGIQAELKESQLVPGMEGGASLMPVVSHHLVFILRAQDAKRAAEVLADFHVADVKRGPDWTCPQCGTQIEGQFAECWSCSGAGIADADDAEDQGLDEREPTGSVDEVAEKPKKELWIEVGVVLTLGVLSYLVSALWWLGISDEERARRLSSHSFVEDSIFHIVSSLSVLVPLLYIIHRSGEGWQRFGVMRLRLPVDLIAVFVVVALWQVFVRPVNYLVYLAYPDGLLDQEVPEIATAAGFALLIVMELANAFAEELLNRGYLIHRFTQLSGKRWAAVLVSSAIFASYHIYYGPTGACMTFIDGVFAGAVFLVYKRLWPLVIAHALHNICIVLARQ